MSSTIYNYITPDGVIVPDIATINDQVVTEWKTALQDDGLSTAQNTPQGLMIGSEVLARQGVTQNNAALANQINPNQAGGVFLDAICALTGLVRQPNTFTRAQAVTLAGVPSSPISAGSIIASPAGDLFSLDGDVTLDPVTGSITGSYTALTPGAIPAPTGLWTIETQVLGLETATNSIAGILGTLEQSDQSLAALRRVTLALQGVSLIEAVVSAVNNVEGVIGSVARENTTNSPLTISDQTLVAHSIWVNIDGGTDIDVATALLDNKSSGCAWNGAHTVNVTEPITGQVYPVKFDRPVLVPLLVRVTCSQGTFVGNITQSVTQAVLDFANNQIAGLKGFVVAQSASPFEVSTGIMARCPGLYVSKVELSLASSVSYAPAEIAMTISQKATVTSGNISLIIV